MACNDFGLRRKSLGELYSLRDKADIRKRKEIDKVIRQKEGQAAQMKRNGGGRLKVQPT